MSQVEAETADTGTRAITRAICHCGKCGTSYPLDHAHTCPGGVNRPAKRPETGEMFLSRHSKLETPAGTYEVVTNPYVDDEAQLVLCPIDEFRALLAAAAVVEPEL